MDLGPDPVSGKNLFRIPDPGVKKAPDPGSRIRIRKHRRMIHMRIDIKTCPSFNTVYRYHTVLFTIGCCSVLRQLISSVPCTQCWGFGIFWPGAGSGSGTCFILFNIVNYICNEISGNLTTLQSVLRIRDPVLFDPWIWDGKNPCSGSGIKFLIIFTTS